MAETKRTDVPPDLPAIDPERELPPAAPRSNPRLNEAAEAIGGALGSATRQVQNMRERFTVIPGGAEGGPSTTEQLKHTAQERVEELQEKVQDVRQRAGAAVEQARIQATAKLADARVAASRMAENARDTVTQKARMVRWRAARLTDERPLAVLAAIAGAAFLLGIFLRVGRGKRG
jgi:ElaB/YqjD/DUF883 family membrane-anchored ribosome-binding protein